MNSMKKGKKHAMDSEQDSLDLIVPSKADFDSLFRTLSDLLEFFSAEEPSQNPDHTFIRYHLADMGKSSEDCLVSCADFVSLCKRWNAPVAKGEASDLYRSFCDSLAISDTQTDGLEMFEVVRLLDILRRRGLGSAGRRDRHGEVDPRRRLFRMVASGAPSSDADQSEGAISAREFLSFLHKKQRETDVDLNDVQDLFYQLNGHRVSRELEDAISGEFDRGRERGRDALPETGCSSNICVAPKKFYPATGPPWRLPSSRRRSRPSGSTSRPSVSPSTCSSSPTTRTIPTGRARCTPA